MTLPIVFDSHPKAAHISRARLTSIRVPGRSAGIRAASTGWVDLTLFEHRVSATIVDYDEDPAELENDVRALALVAHQYLIGGGRIDKKRGWIRTHDVVTISTIHGEWSLGHRWSTAPYP